MSPVAVDVETPDDGGSRGRVTATARRARHWLARDVFPADDTSARTATLAANHDATDFRPDYHVLVEQGDWLLFPWEDASEFGDYDVEMAL